MLQFSEIRYIECPHLLNKVLDTEYFYANEIGNLGTRLPNNGVIEFPEKVCIIGRVQRITSSFIQKAESILSKVTK